MAAKNLIVTAPCYRCGSTQASKVTVSWWGGFVGPQWFHHVKCARCGKTFDAQTGKSNDDRIAVYLAVGMALAVASLLVWRHVQ